MDYHDKIVINTIKRILKDGGFVIKSVNIDKEKKITVEVCLFTSTSWSPAKLEMEESKALNKAKELFEDYGAERVEDRVTFEM